VSPDHQAGTGVPAPRNPGLRPNFQVQHLLCPACGLTFSPCRRYSSRGVHGGAGEREIPVTMDQVVLASPPVTTDQAVTTTGTTSKTPTTAETKEKATTSAAEQGIATHTAAAALPVRSAPSTQSAVLDSPPPPPPLLPPHTPTPHTPQHTITTCKPCNTPVTG
jgi:hypothetical protein